VIFATQETDDSAKAKSFIVIVAVLIVNRYLTFISKFYFKKFYFKIIETKILLKKFFISKLFEIIKIDGTNILN